MVSDIAQLRSEVVALRSPPSGQKPAPVPAGPAAAVPAVPKATAATDGKKKREKKKPQQSQRRTEKRDNRPAEASLGTALD
eukprot:13641903-Alexandrium_andersonii.AAC.1